MEIKYKYILVSQFTIIIKCIKILCSGLFNHVNQRSPLFTVLILSMKQLIITSIIQVKYMYVLWAPLRHLIGLTY